MIAYQREACPSASFPGNQKASKSESEVAQSCLTLCDAMDYTPPGSSIHGILQARILEWVAISFSKSISQSESEVAQSCLTLCDPMDYSQPVSTVDGILQANILEWVAISFSKGSSRPRDQIRVSCIAGKWRRQRHPTLALLPGKSHGWRSLVGCSPWGR